MSGSTEYRLPFETPIYELEARLAEMESHFASSRERLGPEASSEAAEQIRRIRRELANLKRNIFAGLDPWQTVQVSRHPKRPQSRDYLELVFDRFIELHGDRATGDDHAIVTGFAHLAERKVMFIGHQKGKNLAERTACNFGCAHPEGYRKAILKMKLAAKFRIPIVTFIDTPGAYPGIAAEERGQASVIAENLMAMSLIDAPIISIVIGEGGSGGALGIGMGDRVAMMEHAYYSVISPEGCATILWKGADKAPRAAEALRMTAPHLLEFGVIDEVINEPLGGAHRDHRGAASAIKSFLIRVIRELTDVPTDELIRKRYEKFRRMGSFLEGSSSEIPAMVGDESVSQT